MKKIETLSELNQKAWYRLLKVIYIGIIIFLCGALRISFYYIIFGKISPNKS